jgi:hypothetical protein
MGRSRQVDVGGMIYHAPNPANFCSRLARKKVPDTLSRLRTWKFEPAIKQGKPVPAKVTVHVNFRLS